MTDKLNPGHEKRQPGTPGWTDPRVTWARELRNARRDPATLNIDELRQALIDHQDRLRLLLDVADEYEAANAVLEARESAAGAQPADEDLAEDLAEAIPGEHHDAALAVVQFLATEAVAGAAGRYVLTWLRAARAAGLTGRQRTVLAFTFADAIDWRSDTDPCEACMRSGGGPCGQHEAEQQLAAVYAEVASELGITPAPDALVREAILRVIAIGEGPGDGDGH